MHAIMAIGGFQQFEKHCFKVEHIYFQNTIHLQLIKNVMNGPVYF